MSINVIWNHCHDCPYETFITSEIFKYRFSPYHGWNILPEYTLLPFKERRLK